MPFEREPNTPAVAEKAETMIRDMLAKGKPASVNSRMSRIVYWKGAERFREPEKAMTISIITNGFEDDDYFYLDTLFTLFNMDERPDGKVNTSMSVGDVVSIDGRAYVCASMGWERL